MAHIPAQLAAHLMGVSRACIHKWAREGKITRYRDGYDTQELLRMATEGRDLNALLSRAGVSFKDRQSLSDPANKLAS